MSLIQFINIDFVLIVKTLKETIPYTKTKQPHNIEKSLSESHLLGQKWLPLVHSLHQINLLNTPLHLLLLLIVVVERCMLIGGCYGNKVDKCCHQTCDHSHTYLHTKL